MTEEEKKAVEDIEIKNNLYNGNLIDISKEDSKIILNLIENQQKEIERLKNQTQIISTLYVKENYISKETIRKR